MIFGFAIWAALEHILMINNWLLVTELSDSTNAGDANAIQ